MSQVENKSQIEPTISTYFRPSPDFGLILQRLPTPVITDVRCVATSLWHCTDTAQNVLPCPYVAKDGAELKRAKSALDDLFRK